MPDIYCTRCAEPWDASHVRNEAFDGDPDYDGRDNMPPRVARLWDEWKATIPWSGSEAEKEARNLLGLAYYNTGLACGCTACWYDPSRVTSASQEKGLRRAVFDGVWDGDPAEWFA